MKTDAVNKFCDAIVEVSERIRDMYDLDDAVVKLTKSLDDHQVAAQIVSAVLMRACWRSEATVGEVYKEVSFLLGDGDGEKVIGTLVRDFS